MDNPAAIPPGRIRLIPYFRIIWGGKEVIRGNWYLGLIGLHTKGYPRELWIYLSMRGFLRWSAGTLVVTYFVGAAALTWFYSRNPYNKITYADLILPTRWSELRTLRGEANIEEGLAKLKAKQYGAAFMLLNQGLARKPDNIPARLVVAQMYTSMGYFDRAMRIYRDGLPYAGEQRRFIAAAIQLAEYTEDYELVLELIKQVEPVVPADFPSLRTFLQEKRILAYEKLGRYDDIEALWTANQANPTMRLNAAHLRALTATGKVDAAIALLQANPGNYGLLREPWELLLELSIAKNDSELGRRALAALIGLEPTKYRFYAKRIAYLIEIEAESEALLSIDDYFLRFGSDSQAAVMLLKAIVAKPSIDSISSIWKKIQAYGLTGPATRILYVQSLIKLGLLDLAKAQFQLARSDIERTKYRDDSWSQMTAILLDLLGTGAPSAQSQLLTYASSHILTPSAYRAMIDQLVQGNRLNAARDISSIAKNRYRAIKDLPAIVTEADSPIAVAITDSTRPRDIEVISLTEARTTVASVDAAMEAQQWPSALELISSIEKTPLATQLGDQLVYRQISIHAHLSNQTELSWYMRRLLDSDKVEPTKLKSLADELMTAGHANSAQTIFREIIRKYPNAKWAIEGMKSVTDIEKANP